MKLFSILQQILFLSAQAYRLFCTHKNLTHRLADYAELNNYLLINLHIRQKIVNGALGPILDRRLFAVSPMSCPCFTCRPKQNRLWNTCTLFGQSNVRFLRSYRINFLVVSFFLFSRFIGVSCIILCAHRKDQLV